MKKSEFLKRAWSFIDEPRKWITGQEKVGETYCSVGALKAAYHALIAEGMPQKEVQEAYKAVTKELSRNVHNSIIGYNDSHRYHVVAAWWKRVIDKFSAEDEQIEVKVELQPQPAFLKPQQPKVVVKAPAKQPVAEKQQELA